MSPPFSIGVTVNREALLSQLVEAMRGHKLVLCRDERGNYAGKIPQHGIEVKLTRNRDGLYQVGILTREQRVWIRCDIGTPLFKGWAELQRLADAQQDAVIAVRVHALVEAVK